MKEKQIKSNRPFYFQFVYFLENTGLAEVNCAVQRQIRYCVSLFFSILVPKVYNDFFVIYSVNVKNDLFFQGIWSWLVNGSVPYNIRTSFYINPQPSSKNYALNFDMFPNIIDQKFGVQIHQIGNLIRYIKANGLPTQNLHNHSQLFWEYFSQREALYGSSVQFKYFLEEVKAFVFEVRFYYSTRVR